MGVLELKELPNILGMFALLFDFDLLLRGTILNRTYDIHKNLPGIYLAIFTDDLFGTIYFGPP